MLHNSRTMVNKTRQRAIDVSTLSSIYDGCAITDFVLNGVANVKASDGDLYHQFYGISAGPRRGEQVAVRVQSMTATAQNLVIPLDRKVVTNTASVVTVAGVRKTVAYSTAGTIPSTASGTVTIWSQPGALQDVAIFNVADIGDYFVTHRYALTSLDIAAFAGSPHSPGPTPESFLGTIPVIVDGIVCTDAFDPSEDWAAGFDGPSSGTAHQLKVIAGGLFAPGASSKAGILANEDCRLVKAPTADDPWLIVELRG